MQSYAGGRDLWGLADTAKDAKKGWKAPIFNDGLFEVGQLFDPSLVSGSSAAAACHAACACCGRLLAIKLRPGLVFQGAGFRRLQEASGQRAGLAARTAA